MIRTQSAPNTGSASILTQPLTGGAYLSAMIFAARTVEGSSTRTATPSQAPGNSQIPRVERIGD